jgi:hypothetical protein
MDATTTAEKIRCLEERLEAVRVRAEVLSIERKVLAERWVRCDGDEALLLEEITRVRAGIAAVKLEIEDA